MRQFAPESTSANERHRRGTMLVLILVCLPVILAFAVFAINVAWMQLTRTELRTSTDAAARAGSRALSLTQDTAQARAKAVEAAAHNSVAGRSMSIASADVVFGNSTGNGAGGYAFTPGLDTDTDINGIRVLGDCRVGSAAGAIPLLFTGLFDRTTFEPVKSATATQIDRDVILVLDRSGSMNTAIPLSGGSRWDALVVAVQAFVDALDRTPQDELVGLVTYSTNSSTDEHMSLNYANIMTRIRSIHPTGFTAIGKGVESARVAVLDTAYARATAKRTIVVMTDGIHNTGVLPETVSRDAQRNYGITVHTITFSNEANQSHMQTVAAVGGGQHWHADDQASLIAVFEEIAANLPTLLTE